MSDDSQRGELGKAPGCRAEATEHLSKVTGETAGLPASNCSAVTKDAESDGFCSNCCSGSPAKHCPLNVAEPPPLPVAP